MNSIEKIVRQLYKNVGKAFCDACLAASSGVKSFKPEFVENLNPDFVRREEAMCDLCGQTRMTTLVFRNVS